MCDIHISISNELIDSLWPSDIIWQQGSRSTLGQVMACCLMVLKSPGANELNGIFKKYVTAGSIFTKNIPMPSMNSSHLDVWIYKDNVDINQTDIKSYIRVQPYYVQYVVFCNTLYNVLWWPPGLETPYGVINLGQHWAPDGTKTFPETLFTCHQ